MITFIKKPNRETCNFRTPLLELCRAYKTFWFPAAEHCYCPYLIPVIGSSKILHKSIQFIICFSGCAQCMYEPGKCIKTIMFFTCQSFLIIGIIKVRVDLLFHWSVGVQQWIHCLLHHLHCCTPFLPHAIKFPVHSGTC